MWGEWSNSENDNSRPLCSSFESCESFCTVGLSFRLWCLVALDRHNFGLSNGMRNWNFSINDVKVKFANPLCVGQYQTSTGAEKNPFRTFIQSEDFKNKRFYFAEFDIRWGFSSRTSDVLISDSCFVAHQKRNRSKKAFFFGRCHRLTRSIRSDRNSALVWWFWDAKQPLGACRRNDTKEWEK